MASRTRSWTSVRRGPERTAMLRRADLAIRVARRDAIVAQDAYDLAPSILYDVAKRLADTSLTLVAVFLALPAMLLIALLIKLDSRGPVLFRQTRLGKDLRPFVMLKFRSMHRDCDLPAELAAQNETTGPLFKMRHDPRITRVGRLLRRTSLDELPQLFNVLAGTMSLVGPRPPLPRELAGYDEIQRRRLRVVPGLTGLWQISGRSNLPFEEMVRLDLRYIEKRSLLLDALIILKTVPCVLLAKGAY